MAARARISREHIDNAARAVDSADYSVYRWTSQRSSAVVCLVATRPGGFTLAVPSGFLSEARLTAAAAEGFSGGLGPHLTVLCRPRDDSDYSKPESEDQFDLLLIDLDDSMLKELSYLLTLTTRGLRLFQVGAKAGFPYGPDLASRFEDFKAGGEDRVSGYDTAVSGGEGSAVNDLDGEPATDDEVVAARADAGPLPRLPGSARAPPPAPAAATAASRRGELDELRAMLFDLSGVVKGLAAAQADAAGPAPSAAAPALGAPGGAPGGFSSRSLDPQTFEEAARVGLSGGELKQLASLAGPSPRRLGDPPRPLGSAQATDDHATGGSVGAPASGTAAARRALKPKAAPLPPPGLEVPPPPPAALPPITVEFLCDVRGGSLTPYGCCARLNPTPWCVVRYISDADQSPAAHR